MSKFIKAYVLIVLLLLALPNQFFVANAASFNKKINEIIDAYNASRASKKNTSEDSGDTEEKPDMG